MPTIDECVAVLKSIDSGTRTIVPDQCPRELTHGDICYVTNDGWKIVVFNDGMSFDYIDRVESPAGEVFDCWAEDRPQDELFEVRHWNPSGDWWLDYHGGCKCPWCKPRTPHEQVFVNEVKRLKAMMDSQRDAVITALGSHAMDSWRTRHAPLDTLVRQVVFNLESMAQAVIQAKRQN